jgi:IPT/TIG domain
MTTTFNKTLLSFTCLLLSVVVLVSCDKDDSNGTSDKIILLSFGPTGAKHGDTLRFIGNKLDQVTSIEFTGNAAVVNKTDFKVQTSELILLLVPQAAEKGYVTLKTPQGDIITKTQLNLGVVTTVTALTGQARPGDNVTITGTYLNWVESVTFVRDKTVATFVSKSFNQLVVKIPLDAESGPLVLKYGGTDSSFMQTADTLKVTLPVATSFAPNPVKHQTNVTITGTNLDLAKKVMFTGVVAPVTTFVSQTATQLVINIPAATRKGKVTFEAASGVQTVSVLDLDVVLPAVTNMTPNPIAPGANLTVTGTNLDLVRSITFENRPAVTTFVSQSATQIVVASPVGMAAGKITLGVLNSTVTVQSASILDILGGPPPPTVALPFYDEGVTTNWTATGWIGGGWGGTVDYNNATPVRVGAKSARIAYSGGYGSPMQLGGNSINMAPYTTFKISIYGGPGTAGRKVKIVFNGAGGYEITLGAEGQWTDYAIPRTSISAANTLSEIWLQEFSGVGFTVYVDAMGLN